MHSSRQLQHYLYVCKAVDDFRAHAEGQISRLDGGAREDLQRKHASLLVFNFEAAVRLKAWDKLMQIIEVF